MDLENINEEMNLISRLIDSGEFKEALNRTYGLLKSTEEDPPKEGIYNQILFSISSYLVDIGHMHGDEEAASKGLILFEEKQEDFINIMGEIHYYYNLANAKMNVIGEKNPFKQTFETIEQLVEHKSYLWKAIKASRRENGSDFSTHIVNLGNSLKQQLRIAEALRCYEEVNLRNEDVPQSWINRSETLMILNNVTASYSIQMLHQVKLGYEKAALSENIPPQWKEHYLQKAKSNSDKINKICIREGIELDIHDEETTRKEYEGLSDFRRFCLDNNLSLSEHGLYCKCLGSARDNLTIPNSSGVSGDFIVPMEMVLNRVKSEFSFARRLFFEYKFHDESLELLHESCFSELFNDELLGIEVEKLRTAFRLCFGVLDKIAVAICELYDLYPSSKNVSFQSFWQLDQGDRRQKFEKVKTSGLLALYSIATDLNERKNGELSFFKEWRNGLEHEFIVVHKEEKPSDVYGSYGFIRDIKFIKEDDFVMNLEQLLQITRSAIFSFVFSVRETAMTNKESPDELCMTREILRKDFE